MLHEAKCNYVGVSDAASLDVKDVVKWFKPDGSAIREDLSPVKVNLSLSFCSFISVSLFQRVFVRSNKAYRILKLKYKILVPFANIIYLSAVKVNMCLTFSFCLSVGSKLLSPIARISPLLG